MKLCVIGDSKSAAVIRGYLGEKFVLVDDRREAHYTVDISVADGPEIIFDSIDCPLEKNIKNHVRKLTSVPIRLKTAGGVQSDTECSIAIPNDKSAEEAVEKGVNRGFLDLLNRGDNPINLRKVPVKVDDDTLEKVTERWENGLNQLARLFSGKAQEAGREQAERDYAVISARTQADMEIAVAKLRADLAVSTHELKVSIDSATSTMRKDVVALRSELMQQVSIEMESIHEQLRVRGERHASLWTRIVAAFRNRVVVLEDDSQ